MNRLRYYTKIGLIPHAVRRQAFPGQPFTIGYYPEYTLDLLLKVQGLRRGGHNVEKVKAHMRLEQIKAVVGEMNGVREIRDIVHKPFFQKHAKIRYAAIGLAIFALATVATVAVASRQQFGSYLASFAPPAAPDEESRVLAATTGETYLEVNLPVVFTTGGITLPSENNRFTINTAADSNFLTVVGGVTLDQNLSKASTPTFADLNLTSGTIVLADKAQTLTNKTISGSSNTFSNIPNSALSNSKVTISAGSNLSGGGDVSLGSSLTLSLKSDLSISSATISGDLGVVGLATVSGRLSTGGNFVPLATNVQDIGTSSLVWNNIYVNNVIGGSSGTQGFWQRNSNSLSPTNITDSVLVGGTATSSAKFQVYGLSSLNPVASISASSSKAAFIVDNTVGDLFTASSSGLNRFVITQNGNVGIGTTAPGYKLDVNGATNIGSGLTVAAGNISLTGSQSLDATAILTIGTASQTSLTMGRVGAPTTINGSTVSIGGTQLTINNATDSGTLGVGGEASFSAKLVLDSPTAQINATQNRNLDLGFANTGRVEFLDGSNYIDINGNLYLAGSLISGGSQAGFWQRPTSTGILAPANITDSVLVGGTATSSAKFQIYGLSALTPVASISAASSKAAFMVDNTVGDLFTASSSGLNRFVITQNGNVGIGTSLPVATLQNAGSTLFGVLAVVDLATGGDIGTAANTVDKYTSFALTQTTGGQTVTLPAPTNTTAGRLVYLSNTGTASFTFLSSSVQIGTTTVAVWNGSAWTLAGGGGLSPGTLANSTLRWNSVTSQWVENTALTADSLGNATASGILGVGTEASVSGKLILGSLTPQINATNNQNLQLGFQNTGRVELVNSSNYFTATTGFINSQAICTAAGNCSGVGGIVGGTGTQNYITKWNNAGGTNIGDSTITDDGSLITLGSNASAAGTLTLSSLTPQINATNNRNLDLGFADTGRVEFLNSNNYFTATTAFVNSSQICTASGNCSGVGGVVGGTGTQNYITKWNNVGGTTIGDSLLYDNGSAVALGTTTPLADLDVRKQSGLISIASISGATAKAALVVDNSGTGDLFTASSSGLNRFVITQNGNVGIRTTVPNTQLHLDDPTNTGPQITLSAPTGGTPGIIFRPYQSSTQWTNPAQASITATDFSPYSATISFYTKAPGAIGNALTKRMLIQGNGNVGIGNMATAYGLLSLIGTGDGGGSMAYGIEFQGDGGGWSQAAIWSNGYSGYNGDLILATDGDDTSNRNPTEKVRIKGTGNVGIGTSSPLGALDVRKVSGTAPVATVSGATSFASLVVDNSGVGDIFTASSSGLNRFVITQNGNVGIGSSIPSVALDVVGALKTTTSVTVGSGLTVSAGNLAFTGSQTIDGTGTLGIGGTSQTSLSIGRSGAQTTINGGPVVVNGASFASAGTTTFTGGNVGIGTSTVTDFGLELGANIGPVTTDQYDLGSSSLEWNNIYVKNVISAATGTAGYWQRSLQALSPTNITDDVLVGGTATASALLKISGLNVTTGNGIAATQSAITTGNLLSLGQGGTSNFSGNGILLDLGRDLQNAAGAGFTGNFLKFLNGSVSNFIVDAAGKITTLFGASADASKQLNGQGFTVSNYAQTAITDTAATLGTGADGACSTSTTTTLDTGTCVGRANGDAVNFRVTNVATAGATLVTVSSTPTGLAVNDEVLIINLRGTSTDYSNVGKYETHKVTAVTGNVLTLDYPLTYSYDGSTQDIMVQRVPQYTSVTVSSGGSLTITAYSTSTHKGGVIFFRATGTVNVASGGTITAAEKGYAGGAGAWGGSPAGGTTYNGAGGNGGTLNSSGTAGQGGGGAGSGTGTGASGTVGGAGGGGGDSSGGGGGGGGGAGYASVGGGGKIDQAASNGSNGSGTSGGAGGNGNSSNRGGGGGGGGTYGSANLNSLYLGSGGGGGGFGASPGTGGAGGGIILVVAANVSVSGTISANGSAGTNGPASGGGGGGGAGGSVYLRSVSLTLGSSLVTASAGSGGTGNGGANNGGDGGSGRIRVDGSVASGTTSPAVGYYGNPAYLDNPSLLVNRIQSGPVFGAQYNGAPIFTLDTSGSLVATGSSGLATLALNQTSTGDLFTASKSGVSKFVINSSGYVGVGLGANVNTTLATVDLRSLLGTQPVASISGATSMASLVVDNSGSGDIFTASSSGLSRLVITQNGNVGIGTTVPTNLLSIYKNNASFTGMADMFDPNATGIPFFAIGKEGGTANAIAWGWDNANQVGGFWVWGDSLGTGLTLKKGGNVGIGTTSPIGLLHVQGVVTGKALATFNQNGGDQAAFTASVSGTTKFVINNSGYVGVGAGANNNTLLATVDLRSLLGTQPVASISGSTSMASLVVDNSGSGDIFTASSSGLSRLVITQNGNVGIGTTTTATRFDVISSDNTTNDIGEFRANNLTAGIGISYQNVHSIGSASNLNLLVDAKGTGYLALQTVASGNVGVGVVSPAAKLEVVSSPGNPEALFGRTSGAGDVFLTDNSVNGQYSTNGNGTLFLNYYSYNSGVTQFRDTEIANGKGGNVAFFQGSTGNVGIGTTSPIGLLHVQGVVTGKALATFNQNGGDQAVFTASVSGTTKFVINNSGYVGVGLGANVNTTLATVDLRSLLGTQPVASISGATSMASLVVDNSGVGDIFTASSSGLNRFVITQGGNIGIGSTAPAAVVDIASSLTGTNYFNISSAGTSLFTVSDTAITNALPTSFTAAGDVAIAYDINFTNPTSSYIKSAAPLYLQAGETFNSSDLTLRTFNKGLIQLSPNEAVNITGAATVSGQLVLGTATPALGPSKFGKLYIEDSGTATAAAFINNTGTGSTQYLLTLKSAATTVTGVHFIDILDLNGKNIGTAKATSATVATWQSGGIDLAEYMKADSQYLSSGKVVDGVFDQGRVICQGATGVVPCNEEMSTKVVGVMSLAPAFLGGEEGPDKVMVGLVGQLPVKIATDSGQIHSGDLVTVAAGGEGKKITGRGYVVGKAVTDGNPGEKVMVLVNPSYYEGDSLSLASKLSVDQLQEQMASLSASLSNSNLAAGSNYIDIASFSAELATISGNLTVLGQTQLAQTSIGGPLSVGLLHFDDLKASINSLTGLVTVEGNLKITGGLILKDKTTGEDYCVQIDKGEIIKNKGQCQ
ncbi:hypothetical protein HY440_03110 [Candidatus Microgenomates bacterium]|nr:hypothetical protein [Candidatus Microgenomates bacterium]